MDKGCASFISAQGQASKNHSWGECETSQVPALPWAAGWAPEEGRSAALGAALCSVAGRTGAGVGGWGGMKGKFVVFLPRLFIERHTHIYTRVYP